MSVVTKGLQCDSPGCDYFDPQALPTAETVGRLCPYCGQNLFTEEDFISLKRLGEMVELVNAGQVVPDGTPQVEIPLEMDGSGEIRLKEGK